ncbi:MAG: DUF87 domain-containing protein [Pseudomonadota bacterium]
MSYAIPPSVLEQHTAFLGKTGSGKTSTAKLCVEQIVRDTPNPRVCILDAIKSDWWGLISSADGKRPGLPFYVLGGPHGHAQLHPSSGKAIGELVASGALPLSIIDMADFPAGGLQEFFNDFAPALLKRMRGVVHLVMEEAHEFAPKERAGIGAESMAIYNAKKLATAGRSKGIRLMVVTQRTQALHNAMLGSCDTMIAHRLAAPADQEPVKKWLKANVDKATMETVAGSMSSLKTGSAWLCSGEAQVAELVQFPKIATFDNSATPTGDMAEQSVKTAAVDLDKLRAIIGSAVKEAEENDPVKLKAEIAALRKESASKFQITQNPVVDPSALEEAEQRGFQQGYEAGETYGFKAGFDEASDQGAIQFNTLKEQVRATVNNFATSFDGNVTGETFRLNLDVKYIRPSVSPAASKQPASAPMPRAAPPARTPSPAAGGDGTYSKAVINALTAMAELRALGVERPSREIIAAMANYTNIQSRPIRDAFGLCIVDGLAECLESGTLTITAKGIRLAGGLPARPTSSKEMRDRIVGVLDTAAGKALDYLIKIYPRADSREAIAESCGYSNVQSRPIRDAFSKLLEMKFIERAQSGSLAATKALFP